MDGMLGAGYDEQDMADLHETTIVSSSGTTGPDRVVQWPDLAKLAHELRTPLAAIAALAEIMRDERMGPLAERYRGYATDIHRSAEHSLAVLASLVDAGERATGGASSRRASLDACELVASTVSLLVPLAERTGVRLTATPHPSLPRLDGDRRALVQVLLNLLTNAIRATPPGGEVQVTTRLGRDGAVVLEVADTGDGMSEAELARVLAPRAEPHNASWPAEAARRRGGGTSYGLGIVRQLVADHGARLEFASAPGKGTRAIITFAQDRPARPDCIDVSSRP